MRKILSVSLVSLFHLIVLKAHATQLSVGLDWDKKVFVQELWRDGNRNYVLENKTGADVEVKLQLVRRVNGVSIPETGRNTVAVLPPNDAQIFSSSSLNDVGNCKASCFVRFEIVGVGDIGLLSFDPAPQEFANSVWTGINGSGGQDNQDWVVLHELVYKSGAPFQVTLRVKANSGTIDLPLHEASSGGLKNLELLGAWSKTLALDHNADRIRIDTQSTGAPGQIHDVTVTLQAPVISGAKLMIFPGWHCRRVVSGQCVEGHQMARGILIVAP